MLLRIALGSNHAAVMASISANFIPQIRKLSCVACRAFDTTRADIRLSVKMSVLSPVDVNETFAESASTSVARRRFTVKLLTGEQIVQKPTRVEASINGRFICGGLIDKHEVAKKAAIVSVNQ